MVVVVTHKVGLGVDVAVVVADGLALEVAGEVLGVGAGEPEEGADAATGQRHLVRFNGRLDRGGARGGGARGGRGARRARRCGAVGVARAGGARVGGHGGGEDEASRLRRKMEKKRRRK